jgi:HSP20 family molecular chaperone IbpA
MSRKRSLAVWVPVALLAGLTAGGMVGYRIGHVTGRLAEKSSLLTQEPPPGSIGKQAVQAFQLNPPPDPGSSSHAANAMANLLDSFIASQFEVDPIANIPLERREDAKAVYIDVLSEGIQKNDLKISVAEGTVTITGSIDRGGFSARFEKSFPVPEGADASRVQIRPEGDRVVIEFPK